MFPEALVSERLRLERLTDELVDVYDLYALCGGAQATGGDVAVRPDVGAGGALLEFPHATVKETYDFLGESQRRWREGEAATYGVIVEDDVVGLATLEPDWERRTGNLALWLAPVERGRGYAQEVGDLLVDVVFDDLDLDLVAVHHDVGADTARRALETFLERNGGRLEARIRNAVNRGGELVDQRRYTLSRAEYRDE